MHNFRKLEVWRKSRSFAVHVYQLTNTFPKEELFGITNQIRRASISIPSNISEGCSRRTNKAFKHYLAIALGSAFEVETQILISFDLGFINNAQLQLLQSQINEIQSMIIGLNKSIT